MLFRVSPGQRKTSWRQVHAQDLHAAYTHSLGISFPDHGSHTMAAFAISFSVLHQVIQWWLSPFLYPVLHQVIITMRIMTTTTTKHKILELVIVSVNLLFCIIIIIIVRTARPTINSSSSRSSTSTSSRFFFIRFGQRTKYIVVLEKVFPD